MQTNTAKFTGKPLEVVPAGTVSTHKKPQMSILKGLMPALAVFGLAGIVCALMVQPASAEINLSFVGPLFTSLFDAITSIFPSFEAFIDAGFPLLIKIFVYMAILGVIGLGLYLFRGVIEKVINAIGIGGH